MPDVPRGKDNYGKKHPKHQYKALSSTEELGDMHLATENYSVALEYYEQTLQKIHLTPVHGTELVRVYRKISDCYRKKGLLREAMTFLKSAESHCEEDDEIGKGTLACRRGIILYDEGNIEKALREACNAYRILRTSDEHREVAHAQLLIANCYARLGRNNEAEQYFLDALSSYRRIDDSVGESYVLNNLGLFHKNACRWGRALHFLNRALEICNEVGLTQHRVRVTLNLGIVHLKRRDFAGAESSFTSARTMAKQIGDDLKYTRATMMLGVTETRTGSPAAAEKHLFEARVLAEQRHYGREIALADEFLGDLMTERGELDSAIENYLSSLAAAKRICPEGDIVAEVLRRMIHVYYQQRKIDDVLTIGQQALKIAHGCGELHEVGFIERTLGMACAHVGREEEAWDHLSESVRFFAGVNNTFEANRSNCQIARFLLKKGDRKSLLKAKVLMQEILTFFERSEEYRDLAESHFLLARIERELQGRDECLLHMYEAQRLAEDLRARNLVKRIKRMRRKVEAEAAGIAADYFKNDAISNKLADLIVDDPQAGAYLDYVLVDLMRKLTVGHGFVALCNSDNGATKVRVLTRRGIEEETTRRLTEWFLNRDGEDLSQRVLITDTLHDRRSSGIRDILPGRGAPVYFHPLCRCSDPFGLLFFQSDEHEGESPCLGSNFFIGFLVRGILSDDTKIGKQGAGGNSFEQIITGDDKMRTVISLAERVAESDSTVLLMGETGTGKGLIAQAIHRFSPRRDKKFVHVNCAALPETLLESELFGHVKGSFTGAVSNKKGLLAEADGGTIFLDEIGKTSLPLQGKLLQFLDTKKVRPVGGNEMFGVDVRLIFASKVDLRELCRDSRMLEDFYYRISDFPISIPPLRERIEDVRLLAEHYLNRFCGETGKRILGFSDEALAMLTGHDWPGNVRELEKIVKRAIILSDENGIITHREIMMDEGLGGGVRTGTLAERVRTLEKRMIAEALARHKWNRRAAASDLGISYPTILKKIRSYKITR
jgi:two-component system NtrC family response regulator